jgi:hypothetical protein
VAREAGRAARDVRPGRCGQCDRALTGRESSLDYCSPHCQDRWHARRADHSAVAHSQTETGLRLGIHRNESSIWALPKVSAVRPCTA